MGELNGRELDFAVAEQVMGLDRANARVDSMNRNGEPQYHFGYPVGHDFAPNYSTDIAAAMQVIEKLRADGWTPEISSYYPDLEWDVVFERCEQIGDSIYRSTGHGECSSQSLPECICRAALAAIESTVSPREDG